MALAGQTLFGQLASTPEAGVKLLLANSKADAPTQIELLLSSSVASANLISITILAFGVIDLKNLKSLKNKNVKVAKLLQTSSY